jgi:diaminohydroxyphosphoribosylaminopyrimidine deaminase / 5-amino-6-(5-phosphoribosylamino)uracil reductase
VLVDDPGLTTRSVYRARPLVRVVFDRRLRTPPMARLFSTPRQGPVIILTTADAFAAAPERAQALVDAGARVEPVGGADLADALRRLGSAGVTSLLLEGGPTLQAAAWLAGLVDCVHLYVAPIYLGKDGVPWLPADVMADLVETRVETLGPDVFTEGYVHRSC